MSDSASVVHVGSLQMQSGYLDILCIQFILLLLFLP